MPRTRVAGPNIEPMPPAEQMPHRRKSTAPSKTPAPEGERRVVLERKHWQAGAGHFEFKNDELIVRAIFKCPEAVMEIEMSWPSATDLPF